jgi:hypothetical protein
MHKNQPLNSKSFALTKKRSRGTIGVEKLSKEIEKNEP